MPELGILGNCLVQAAKESDSSVADLITTQKQTMEQERKTRFRKISGEKTTRGKYFRKNRFSAKKEGLSQNLASSESSESLS